VRSLASERGVKREVLVRAPAREVSWESVAEMGREGGRVSRVSITWMVPPENMMSFWVTVLVSFNPLVMMADFLSEERAISTTWPPVTVV